MASLCSFFGISTCSHDFVNVYSFDIFEVLLAAGTKSEHELSEVENSKEDSEVDTVADETLLESNGNDSESKQEAEQDENGSETNRSTFSYEQLKAHSENPVTGIDFKRREVG